MAPQRFNLALQTERLGSVLIGDLARQLHGSFPCGKTGPYLSSVVSHT
jgi:hypothetical protein